MKDRRWETRGREASRSMDRKWKFGPNGSGVPHSLEPPSSPPAVSKVSPVVTHLLTNLQQKFGTERARRSSWWKCFRCVRCQVPRASIDDHGNCILVGRLQVPSLSASTTNRLLWPSGGRVCVHLPFHPCLASSCYDRNAAVTTSALYSVYPFHLGL